jgi:aminopeptidase N
LLLALILSGFHSLSFANRRERQNDAWKPVHYDVSLAFNDQLTELTKARAEITIVSIKDSLSVIDLDFGELTVDSVSVNNQPAPFERSTGMLNVKLTKRAPEGIRLVAVVVYHGKPKDGLILTADKDGRPSAIGDNWPNRVHHWIPCLDHPAAKASVSFTVTAPAKNTVVANGQLGRIQNSPRNTRTWSYTESVPIPPYCMIIAVGQFAQVVPTRHETPLSYYVPQSDKKFAMQGFAPANPSLKFFSQTVAPYPYEKLALIVGATRFGGMENSSAIVFTSTLFDPRQASERQSRVFKIRAGIVDVVAHEIAHQWFGDSVTESTWSDLWLSEGFATYFAGLFIQRYEGEEAFHAYMTRAAETYFRYEQKTRTPIFDKDTEDLFELLNPNNYQKGAWVLHMLRSQLGDKAFFRGIRDYYEAHKNSTATTEDLRLALERSSGQDLRGFFNSWVYSPGHPRYELTWKWEAEKRVIEIVLKQLQTEPAFPNWLPVEITTAKGKRQIIFKPTGKETIQTLPLNEMPVTVAVDPDNTVLKEVTVKTAR